VLLHLTNFHIGKISRDDISFAIAKLDKQISLFQVQLGAQILTMPQSVLAMFDYKMPQVGQMLLNALV
jgi:hypothetical protein